MNPTDSAAIPTLYALEPRLALSASPAPVAGLSLRTDSAPDVPVPRHRRDLATTGRSRYWNLTPGFTAVFEGVEDGEFHHLTITVTRKARVIDGIPCRVVVENEQVEGVIQEISQNYFAFDRRTKNVYYFGEDTDIYEGGVITSHEGSWASGVNGAKFGLVMPGNPALGAQLQQERAPGIAEDLAEIVQTGRRAHTPAGTFKGAFKTRETTPLEPDVVEFKMYAPGVGLVQDGSLSLVSCSPLED
jgi:hypothetical protein